MSIRRMGIRRDTGGAVYVEFIIAFIPFFTMFLGMVQIGMYYSAGLLVRHAATTAARAAVVVLPDNPDEYDGEAINQIDGDDDGSSTLDIGAMIFPTSVGGSRISAIRNAASIPLLGAAPSLGQLTSEQSVINALGDPESRFATGAARYNRAAVAVTFPREPGANDYKTSFEPREQIITRVTYLFHCGVPIVSRILCDDYASLRFGIPAAHVADLASALRSGDLDRIRASSARLQRATERLDRESAGVDELGEAAAPYDGFVYSAFGARFRVLRAEATMTNQGAGFTYE